MFENLLTNSESLEIKAKGSEKVSENLQMLRMMRTQCLVWYRKAEIAEDFPTMFLLETEIQYFLALEAGIRWALGINRERLVSPTRVAIFNQRREMDEIETTKGS